MTEILSIVLLVLLMLMLALVAFHDPDVYEVKWRKVLFDIWIVAVVMLAAIVWLWPDGS